ncbi:MAG: hypothetical protein NC127_09940, partial [Muribaculum sp.]|nr:hypothetical protein [Muribaculum sp.]
YADVVVAREGDTCVVFTDASSGGLRYIKQDIPKRMADYIGNGGYHLKEVNSRFIGRYIVADTMLWYLNGITIAPVTLGKYLHPVNAKVDYALISSRFRGDLTDVADTLHPDTIILSPNIEPHVKARFEVGARNLSIPLRYTLPMPGEPQ